MNKNKSLVEGNIIIKLLGFLILILTILTVNSSKLTSLWSLWNGIIGFGNNFYNEWVVSISINIIIFLYLFMNPQITNKVSVKSTKYSLDKFKGIIITIIFTTILMNSKYNEFLPYISNISLTHYTENFTIIIISLIITIIYITSINR